jgi:hypothetical protein
MCNWGTFKYEINAIGEYTSREHASWELEDRS